MSEQNDNWRYDRMVIRFGDVPGHLDPEASDVIGGDPILRDIARAAIAKSVSRVMRRRSTTELPSVETVDKDND